VGATSLCLGMPSWPPHNAFHSSGNKIQLYSRTSFCQFIVPLDRRTRVAAATKLSTSKCPSGLCQWPAWGAPCYGFASVSERCNQSLMAIRPAGSANQSDSGCTEPPAAGSVGIHLRRIPAATRIAGFVVLGGVPVLPCRKVNVHDLPAAKRIGL